MVLLLWIIFVICVLRVFYSVHYCLVLTCWEGADLLALLCVMFHWLSVTFPCGVLGQVWCFIVSILGSLLSFLLLWKTFVLSFRIGASLTQQSGTELFEWGRWQVGLWYVIVAFPAYSQLLRACNVLIRLNSVYSLFNIFIFIIHTCILRLL